MPFLCLDTAGSCGLWLSLHLLFPYPGSAPEHPCRRPVHVPPQDLPLPAPNSAVFSSALAPALTSCTCSFTGHNMQGAAVDGTQALWENSSVTTTRGINLFLGVSLPTPRGR